MTTEDANSPDHDETLFDKLQAWQGAELHGALVERCRDQRECVAQRLASVATQPHGELAGLMRLDEALQAAERILEGAADLVAAS
jgi:hypothetical protein